MAAELSPDTRFVEALASSSPVPGGGGASAYAGALASALASMVGELTVGKKAYADVEEAVEASLARLGSLRGSLLESIEADAEAFEPLAAAYRMPRSTPEEAAARDAAMQSALVPACDVPLSIMEDVCAVLDECLFLAENGSRMAVSDAGACAAIGYGALEAAGMNVWINVSDISDPGIAGPLRDRAEDLLAYGARISDEALRAVYSALGFDPRGPSESPIER